VARHPGSEELNMFPTSFDYHRPKTVDEALKLLHDVKGARILAGGHSLIPAMKLRLSSPAALIDITRIPDLNGIREASGGVQIGALTTHAAVASSDVVRRHFPVLADAAGIIGDTQVRNRGTIGGSLAHADPGADYPTLMLLLGAKFTIADGRPREIAAEHFFVDLFTTALQPGELLTWVSVPPMPSGAKAVYLKHRHPASAFAVVGVAALAGSGEVRIAIGGACSTPVRASAAERALKGQPLTEANIARAADLVKDALREPLSDTYASGEFRAHLAMVMTKRALAQIA